MHQCSVCLCPPALPRLSPPKPETRLLEMVAHRYVGLELLLRGLIFHMPGRALSLQSPPHQRISSPCHTACPLSLNSTPAPLFIPSPPLNSICPIRFFSGYGCSRQGWEPCHGVSQSTWLGLDSLPSPFGARSLKSLVLFSPSPALSRALLNGLSADCWILHGCPKGPCGLRKWSLKGPAAACRLL